MSSSSVLKLNTLPAREGSSIGAALGEVAVAFKHLATALVRNTFAPAVVQTPVLTAYQEAEQLRTYASDIQAQDPEFAQDLFAAADRHEIEAAAAAAKV
jgi:hypothetical protein